MKMQLDDLPSAPRMIVVGVTFDTAAPPSVAVAATPKVPDGHIVQLELPLSDVQPAGQTIATFNMSVAARYEPAGVR